MVLPVLAGAHLFIGALYIKRLLSPSTGGQDVGDNILYEVRCGSDLIRQGAITGVPDSLPCPPLELSRLSSGECFVEFTAEVGGVTTNFNFGLSALKYIISDGNDDIQLGRSVLGSGPGAGGGGGHAGNLG